MSATRRFIRNELPSLAGMAGAMAIRSAIGNAYEARRGHEVPVDPSLDGVRWSDAVVWTVLLAAGAAVGRLVASYAVGEAVNKTYSQRQIAKS